MLALKVENLSKKYQIGEFGTGSLRHDIRRYWFKLLGKEDPYAPIVEENDRTTKGNSDFVWALRDINFELKKGETVALIGRNGAGKTTLLKLLCSVTQPSEGKIYVNGRIAALLGARGGFAAMLTGRENIYLRGSILGMKRREIDANLDKIIEFAGIERYIDTPMKRYSSGMRLRLSFAIASHLISDILIIDEGLAVGDEQFRQKCLKRIKEIVLERKRTVILVSHRATELNMLCDKALYLDNGRLKMNGGIEEVLDQYVEDLKLGKDGKHNDLAKLPDIHFQEGGLRIHNFHFLQRGLRTNTLEQGIAYDCVFTLSNETAEDKSLLTHFELTNEVGVNITYFGNYFQNLDINVPAHSQREVVLHFDHLLLKKGEYSLGLHLFLAKTSIHHYERAYTQIEVTAKISEQVDGQGVLGVAWLRTLIAVLFP